MELFIADLCAMWLKMYCYLTCLLTTFSLYLKSSNYLWTICGLMYGWQFECYMHSCTNAFHKIKKSMHKIHVSGNKINVRMESNIPNIL